MKAIEYESSKYIVDKQAFAELKKLGLPTKKTEEFVHFDITTLLSNDYKIDLSTKDSHCNKDNKFYTIIICNGIIDKVNSDIPTGVSFKSIAKEKLDTNNALFYFSEAFLKDTQSIIVSKNLDKALKIINIFSGNTQFIPMNLKIVLEKGLHADILEVFDDKSLENSFINTNKIFDICKDSKLYYTKLQNLKTSNNMIENYVPKLKESSTCKASSIDLGANISLNIIDVVLNHENSNFLFSGIVKINGNKKVGNIASMLHEVSNTTSDFICKHILSDEAHGLFEVKSIVKEKAKFSKTFQNSQTILLNDGPKINAIPQLILHTDELEAAHGATSGSLDEEALYYLMSRGINEKDASNMLIKAIELQIIDTISNTQIKEFASDFLKR